MLAKWRVNPFNKGKLVQSQDIVGNPVYLVHNTRRGHRKTVQFWLGKVWDPSPEVLAEVAWFLTHMRVALRFKGKGYTTETSPAYTRLLEDHIIDFIFRRELVDTTGSVSVAVRAASTATPFTEPPTAAEIDRAVRENTAYRRVLYTAPDRSLQMVAMTTDAIIPEEVHPDVHQYFLPKEGHGEYIVDGRAEPADRAHVSARWVMRGQRHEVVASAGHPLHLFVTYVPAHHPETRLDQFNTDVLRTD